MATYIAFLRAINLGAKRKFPKDAIKQAVEDAGFTDVETYINTGNVRFDSTMRSRGEDRDGAGEGVPRGPRLRGADDRVHAEGAGGDRRGGGVLRARRASTTSRCSRTSRPQRRCKAVEAAGTADEVARVGGRAVHLLLGENYHEAKLTNAVVEKHLGVATNRNLTVIKELATRWGG